ncbi:hypothetical protein [Thiolinea disciformis]|uniref:hypothetical protein n=1 Tax=Thiolinea disciformis TaxID=125614 RepID=UPI0003741156|nr:hypothetical protein [Thiolinea disciformis]
MFSFEKITAHLLVSLFYMLFSVVHANPLDLNLTKSGANSTNKGIINGYYENYTSNTSGSGISCGVGCANTTTSIDVGSQIYLYASTNDAGYVFDKWTGSGS